MQTETNETPNEEQTQEQEQQQETTAEQQADDDAALEAGFHLARGEEPPAEATASETDGKTETDTTAASGTEAGDDASGTETETQAGTEGAPGQASQQLLAGLTEDQIKDLFAKVPNLESRLAAYDAEIRKVHGKFGEINSKLQQAGVRKIGKLSRLSEEFPEIAEMLAADLSDILTGGSGGLSPEQSQAAEAAAADRGKTDEGAITEEKVQARINAAVSAVEEKLLTVMHADWKQVAASPEFMAWLTKLPKDDHDRYRYSDDAVVAAEAFTKFKESRKSQKQPSARRQERLAQAIAPKGEGAAPVTQDDDAAFELGFKSIRGKR